MAEFLQAYWIVILLGALLVFLFYRLGWRKPRQNNVQQTGVDKNNGTHGHSGGCCG